MPRDLQNLPKIAEWPRFIGYKSSVPKEEGDNYLALGSENVMLTGSGKTQAFKDLKARTGLEAIGGIVMMNVAERQNAYASLGAGGHLPPTPTTPPGPPATIDDDAFGNVFNVYSALFFIGQGLLRLAGQYYDYVVAVDEVDTSLFVQADATLQLLVKVGDEGYNAAESGPFQGGLAQPSAPTIQAIEPPGGFSGKNNGVVSVVVWRIRSSTGAVSIRSEPSNIAAAGPTQSIAVTILDVDHNGQDYWGIGVTRNGEGSVGSYFELTEWPEESTTDTVGVADSVVGTTPRTIVVEWTDGDLVGKPFAPEHDFPPPTGQYAGAIEDIVFVDGTYASVDNSIENAAIAPSEPGKPESFSPDSVIFTNDIPTALLRGDGLYWRFGHNSCYVIRYLGGEKPLSVQIAWSGIGIEKQHNACLGEGGRLYLWPNERGPMQLIETGMPDGTFATDVADDFVHCIDPVKRVVGWDGRHQVVAFCYEKKIWPWFTALGAWGAPGNVTIEGAFIRSCVTENGRLLICDDLDNLYEYNAGNGSVMKVRTGWVQSNGAMDTVASVVASVRTDNPGDITIDVYADGDDSAPASSMFVTPERIGYQRLPSVWPNVTECESHAIQITIGSTMPDGDCGVESITSYGDAHSMLR